MKTDRRYEKSSEGLGPAPDFALTDTRGREVRLSDYSGKKHVVLVFNRGFS